MVKTTTKQPAKREENALARRGEFAPSPWVSPFAFMRRFSEEMDRLFEGPAGGRGGMTPFFGRTADWTPDVDVGEREGSIVVRADVHRAAGYREGQPVHLRPMCVSFARCCPRCRSRSVCRERRHRYTCDRCHHRFVGFRLWRIRFAR